MQGQKYSGSSRHMEVRFIQQRGVADATRDRCYHLKAWTRPTAAPAMRALLLFALVVFAGVLTASAQSTATVDGIVHDSSGALDPLTPP